MWSDAAPGFRPPNRSPFPSCQVDFFSQRPGAVKGATARERRSFTLDGEDRCGTSRGRERGYSVSSSAASAANVANSSASASVFRSFAGASGRWR